MNHLFLAVSICLILISCNGSSGGGSSKEKDGNGGTGDRVNQNSSKLAKDLSNKIFCSDFTFESNGKNVSEAYTFKSDGTCHLVQQNADINSNQTQTKILTNTADINLYSSKECTWGATTTILTVNVDGKKMDGNAIYQAGKLTVRDSQNEEYSYSECGAYSETTNQNPETGNTSSNLAQSLIGNHYCTNQAEDVGGINANIVYGFKDAGFCSIDLIKENSTEVIYSSTNCFWSASETELTIDFEGQTSSGGATLSNNVLTLTQPDGSKYTLEKCN